MQRTKRSLTIFYLLFPPRYEEYEAVLGAMCEGVDALLDHAAVDLDKLANASFYEKMQVLS